MRSSSASVSVSLPHCLHEMPQYIHTGIGWEMGADFSQIFSIGSSPGVPQLHGMHGMPEADAYGQCVGPRGQAALRLRYVQHAGGWYAYVQSARRACQHSSSQALFAARNEQLMIGAGQPVSLHGSAGPSMQDSDMRKRGRRGVLHSPGSPGC